MAKKATKKAGKKTASKAVVPKVMTVRRATLPKKRNFNEDGFYIGNRFVEWDSADGLKKRRFRNNYEYINNLPMHNSTKHGRDVDDHIYALPAGYKVSKRTGNWYNEYRQNRTDSHQEHYSAYNKNMSQKRKNQTYKHVYIGEEKLVGEDKKLKAVRFTIGYTDYLNNPNHTLQRAVTRYKNGEWGTVPTKSSLEKYGVPKIGLGHAKPMYGSRKYKQSTGMRITKSDVFEYADPFSTPVRYGKAKKATPKKTVKKTAKKTAKKSSSKRTKQTKLY